MEDETLHNKAFISHASEDAAIAAEVCAALEHQGVPCWIAPRDVTPGRDYGSEILGGIESCTVFVLLLSGRANDSGFVRREVERAVSKGKPIFPVRVEEVVPARALELFISSAHWIDAWERPREAHWQRLAAVIRGEAVEPAPVATRGGRRWVVGGIAALMVCAAGGWLLFGGVGGGSARPVADPSPAPLAPASSPSPALPPSPAVAGKPVPSPAVLTGGAAAGPCPVRISINPDLPLPLTCQCGAEAVRDGTVWGTDVYTADSALCRAAAHAGVIPRDGGRVTVEREAGRDLYVGSARNGIATSDYGAYGSSIRFVGGPVPTAGPAPCPVRVSINPDLPMPFSCMCSAESVRDGTVWGTDTYTADSSLCRAAAHAGAISRDGGAITVERAAGRDLYVGSTRNGIATSDYGAYSYSVVFAGGRNPVAGPGPCPVRVSINPDLPMPFSCLCGADAVRDGTVWGTDVYTADSALCQAAVHAGAISREGGRITVMREPGRDIYVGSRRNGVSSSDYGSYATSIRFQ